MNLSPKHVQAMMNRISASKEVIYPSLEACAKDGFLSVGTGLLLRAGAGASTEVWSIESTPDGQLKLLLRSDLGYDPELRSANIERKVIASSSDDVQTPYGIGKRVGTTKEGNPVVAFSEEGVTKRYILNASDVKPVPKRSQVSIQLQAKDPEKTDTRTYLQQYFLQAYGSEEYARELAKSFGETMPG